MIYSSILLLYYQFAVRKKTVVFSRNCFWKCPLIYESIGWFAKSFSVCFWPKYLHQSFTIWQLFFVFEVRVLKFIFPLLECKSIVNTATRKVFHKFKWVINCVAFETSATTSNLKFYVPHSLLLSPSFIFSLSLLP